ncbi:sensor histidine kinase, partial [Actinomadura montaniterrae]
MKWRRRTRQAVPPQRTVPQASPQAFAPPHAQAQGAPQGQPQGVPQAQGQAQGVSQAQPQGFSQPQAQGIPQAQAQGVPQAQAQGFSQAQAMGVPQAAAAPQSQMQAQPPMRPPAQPQMGMPMAAQPQAPARAPARVPADPDVWPDLCERFCLQFLVLAEKMRPAMDLLERQEEDPDRLEALYEIDHGVTRMRRAARDLRVLAGRDAEEASGADTSLLDVIRMAESSIEQYQHVSILRVVELAVPAYAAEDLASLVAALLDNATRYSPSRVTVSAHLLADGDVMLRIEDSGIGMSPTQLDGLNKALAGPVPPMTDETSRQTGFPVVHRLARRHGITVRLAGRTGGTVAMVTIPPSLLCEIPADEPRTAGTAGTGEMPPGMAHLA